MNKIVALDIGDVWVGSAISDATGILAKPLKTITLQELDNFLQSLINQEKINVVIIGNPITLKGTASAQTIKVKEIASALEQKFPMVSFILWDERLSSKRAEGLKTARTKEEKIKSHSRAAAFILDSYLNYLHNIN